MPDPRSPFDEIALEGPAGALLCHHAHAPGAVSAVLMVGGAGGGWDSPSLGLYPRLLEDLPGLGATCLRVRFREPRDMGACLSDVLVGVSFLEKEGAERIVLIGHSLGGAVVLRAAQESAHVVGVAALAPQTVGAGDVASLSPRCALLFLHGQDDPVLPPTCSTRLHEAAGPPKELKLYEGAGHCLDEVAESVDAALRLFMREHLTLAGTSEED